jgi:hypothetical protein
MVGPSKSDHFQPSSPVHVPYATAGEVERSLATLVDSSQGGSTIAPNATPSPSTARVKVLPYHKQRTRPGLLFLNTNDPAANQ